MFAHGQFLAMNLVVLMYSGLFHQRKPGHLQVMQAYLGLAFDDLVGDPHGDPFVVAPRLRHFVQLRRRRLHAFVFDQAAHEFGARIFRLAVFRLGRTRQQHA